MALPSALTSAARQAPFAFFATVRQAGGSNVELLQSDAYPSAIVQIDEVIVVPEGVGDLTGREVTLHLSEPGALRRGSRYLFMATSLEFGKQIALAEVARVPVKRQGEKQLRQAVLEEKLRDLDNALMDRLRRAATVIYGVVERVAPPSEATTEQAEVVGEAVLSFLVAAVRPWRTLKGQPVTDPRVIFPFPRTQKWSEVPLFVEGMEGVWILHSAKNQTLGAAGKVKVPDLPNGFTAFDPLDFQSPGLLSRIAVLLPLSEAER